MAFQSAQRNFLQRTTRGFYRHAPILSYQERGRFEKLLFPAEREAKVVVLATQQQIQDKYRKRGWKLHDSLNHPFNPGHAKVYVKDGAVAVIYPDATISRHLKVQVTYERGWHSPAEAERQRVKRNEKMPAGERRIPAPLDVRVVTDKMLKAFKAMRG